MEVVRAVWMSLFFNSATYTVQTLSVWGDFCRNQNHRLGKRKEI